MITLENINKNFGSKVALKNISCSFEAGKVYGIVGENGAGKTTLFRCIAGLETFRGELKSPYQPLKYELGFLETNPQFMSFLTGREYLKLLCKAKQLDTNNFDDQNIFQLPLDQYAETYSTGMKKKLALMGVLLRKNKVLILDEPFNGVDIQSNMIIEDLINNLKSLSKTVLISSHIFSTLREVCDEIILLSKGEIVKVVSRDGYAELEKEMKEKVIGENSKNIELE